MDGPSLAAACYTAFAAVMVVLAFLAVVIRLVSFAFPARSEGGDDAAVVAAITAAVAARHPGAHVTRIEEAP